MCKCTAHLGNKILLGNGLLIIMVVDNKVDFIDVCSCIMIIQVVPTLFPDLCKVPLVSKLLMIDLHFLQDGKYFKSVLNLMRHAIDDGHMYVFGGCREKVGHDDATEESVIVD